MKETFDCKQSFSLDLVREVQGHSSHSNSRGAKCEKHGQQPIEGKIKDSSCLSCLEKLVTHMVIFVLLKGLSKKRVSAGTVG